MVDERPAGGAAWSRRALRRPTTLLAATVAFGAAFLATMNASCNVHEVAHALVGTAVGWEVDQIHLCPGGSQVTYLSTPDAWFAGPLEGIAGGVAGALFVAGVFWLVFLRRDLPARGPVWWAAGLGVVLNVMPQIVIGAAEGFFGGLQGRDYTEVLEANLVVSLTILAVASVAVILAYVRRWRDVWRSVQHPQDSQSSGL